jgi:hypothetical protein
VGGDRALSESNVAIAYVIATCKADSALVAVATGGVLNGGAPIGTILPYVAIFPQQPGSDVRTGNQTRLMVHVLLQIKMVGYIDQGAYDALETGANEIDALFGNKKNPAPGILACYREQIVQYPDPKLVNGRQVEHKGGLYHFEVQAS